MKYSDFDKSIIVKFIFGRSTPEEDKKIQEWMGKDRFRHQYLEKLIRAKAYADQKKDSEWAKDDFSLVQSRISNRKKPRMFYLAAAVFIGIIILSYSVFIIEGTKDVQWQMISATKGQQNEMLLSDGTKVWLAPDSKLYYPESFSSESREIKLEGQAYLDVAHESNRPFIVHTEYTDIEVLGTKFNVKAYSNEVNTTTVLVEGEIKINLKDKDGKQIDEQLLFPNQKSNYNHASLNHSLHKADIKYDLGWRQKCLYFNNETFLEIARKIERLYDMKVIFKDNELASKRFTGEFKNEPVDAILLTLKEWASFTYETSHNKIYIRQEND